MPWSRFRTRWIARIVGDLAREPGCLSSEGERIVPVRLRAGHRSYLTSVIGLSAGSELRRPHDAALRPIDGVAGRDHADAAACRTARRGRPATI